MRLPCR